MVLRGKHDAVTVCTVQWREAWCSGGKRDAVKVSTL